MNNSKYYNIANNHTAHLKIARQTYITVFEETDCQYNVLVAHVTDIRLTD